MISFRYWLKFILAFVSKFKTLLFVGTIVGAIVFIIISQATQVFSFLNSGKKIGLVGRYSINDLPISIQSDISLGLTTIDAKSNVNQGLAESWEAQDEGKTWIFRLKDSKWQDGSQIRARDINYKFNDVTTEVVDDKTIKFTLEDPFAPFPSVVSRPVFKKGLLGSGSWKVSKIGLAPGSSEILESIKLVNLKDSSVKIYRFYPTEDSARIALKLAEINELQEVVDPKDLKTWKNLNILAQVRENLYTGVFINTQDPIFSDKSLRQALAYAINKEGFEGERAISPIAPYSWSFNPQVKRYEYNQNRAKELINTLPKEQREGLSIKLVTIPTLLPIADRIKDDWDAAGIQTQIQVSNSPPSDFQALLAIQAIPPDPDQYSFWHSTQEATNITKYRSAKESPRIDKLLEDGRRTLNQEERKKIYLDFQRFLVEDCPVIFLYHPVTYTISKK